MASSARIDELKQKFDENPRRYFAPLANEFRKVGDLEQAILICETYLPQQPGHMSGHIVYGQALFESNRMDEAHGVFETALSLDPENLIALRHLGDIAARQGDATSARRWYERVLEADPRNEEIQSLIGSLTDDHGAARDQVSFADSHAEPSATQPATPVEAFAAAPDAHFASHDIVAADVPELLDLDDAMPDSAPAAGESAEAAPSPSVVETTHAADFEPTSAAEFDHAPETRDLMPGTSGLAEGFESTEFSAPSSKIAQEPGLQSAFEDELGINGAAVAPIPGFEATSGERAEEPTPPAGDAFPELDEPLPADEELVLPPHGDSMAVATPAAAPTSRDDSLLDFEMPVPSSTTAQSDVTAGATIPTELPPEVIAAEAELLDATGEAEPTTGESEPIADSASVEEEAETESIGAELAFLDVDSTSHGEPAAAASPDVEPMSEFNPEPAPATEPEAEGELESEPVQTAQRPFVTETMAELYLKQGFRTEALAVYEQLSTANPSDHRLADKVASLRAETAPEPAAGPPVREFFARFATRRPWERAAAAAPPSEDDFAANERAVSEPIEAGASSAAESTASEPPRAAAEPAAPNAPTGGSIDALFGNQPTAATEDSAASALSQAFGGSAPDAPPITGNPARPATGELSLDSVFRDGSARGARNSQGFSFDQFFSQNVDGDRTSGGAAASPENAASGEPAERTADDIEQFNSWLQGLKQR